jgi:hypothetical protein
MFQYYCIENKNSFSPVLTNEYKDCYLETQKRMFDFYDENDYYYSDDHYCANNIWITRIFNRVLSYFGYSEQNCEKCLFKDSLLGVIVE